MEKSPIAGNTYTCNEYREEMILLGLQRKLTSPDLTPEERQEVKREIARVEAQMGLT